MLHYFGISGVLSHIFSVPVPTSTFNPLKTPKLVTSEQCRPSSDAAECGI